MGADIGFIGLAVMGENLVLNIERNGFSVAVFNRTTTVVDRFLAGRAHGKRITGAHSIAELVSLLARPRKIMLIVKAGSAVDAVIDQILPLLEKGDLVIDGGNSHYQDTIRRVHALEAAGIHFIGTGVSGGEEGALRGPSLMPGGSAQAWPLVSPIFCAIAAKADDGTPCCDWVGSDGAGHYVKMIHNGIEYGDMQIIAEGYWFMKHALGMSYEHMHHTFTRWNTGRLHSYLIEITAAILAHQDTDGTPLLEKILDAAGQKGTGRWTCVAALEEGSPLTLITESVMARSLSAQKQARCKAHRVFGSPVKVSKAETLSAQQREELVSALEDALYCAKIVSYAQGFELLSHTAKRRGWTLDFSRIASLWRGGCIIRSGFLSKISAAFAQQHDLENLVLAPFFAEELKRACPGWRTIVAESVRQALPVPALSAALAWFDGFTGAALPANLLQAQRDYFGAHTYERTDAPRGEFFHTNWTGTGGDTIAGTYSI